LLNLQGRTPIHTGNGHTLGEQAGEQAHTLSIAELPTHIHFVNVSTSAGNSVVPTGAILGSPLNLSYGAVGNNVTSLAPATLANVGGSQAHLNMQPFLVLSFCIALQGIYPSPN